jgi:dolichyl-phosphate-mannose--protein O-mannosyl transferase
MHTANMREDEHPYASRWYQWPLATGRWLLCWSGQGRHIICVGNVLLWWPVFAAVASSAIRAIAVRDWESPTASMAAGWTLSLLPFAFIKRTLFIYHYAIPLIFGCCNLGAIIEKCGCACGRGFCYSAVITLAAAGFLLWAPWAYGLSTPDFEFLVWNSRWRM